MTRLPFTALALLGLCACATISLPPERLAKSQATIESADAVGASKNPQAALHMQLAQEGIAKAQQLAKQGDAPRALLFLDRAQADADLALALARQQDANVDAETAEAAVVAIEGGQP